LQALRDAILEHHLAFGDPGFGRRGAAHDRTGTQAIAEKPRAPCRVRSTAGVTDHCEPIEAQVVHQLANIAGEALIAASGVERAETVTGPIDGNEPYAGIDGGLAHTREVVTASR